MYIIALIVLFIIFSILSGILTLFGIKFKKSMLWFIIFYVIWTILNTVIGHLWIGKRHGSFLDTFFIEVKNGYMLEFIDGNKQATLTNGTDTIAVNAHGFAFTIAIHNDNILVLDKEHSEQLIVIDTINKTEKKIEKPWGLKDGIVINEKDLKSVTDFYHDLTKERWEYQLQHILVLLFSMLTGFYFVRKRKKNK